MSVVYSAYLVVFGPGVKRLVHEAENLPQFSSEIKNVCAAIDKLQHTFDYFLLGAFEKLRKANVSFAMSCLSVCLSVRIKNSAPNGVLFRKYVEKIKVYSKPDKNNVHFTRRRFDICDNT